MYTLCMCKSRWLRFHTSSNIKEYYYIWVAIISKSFFRQLHIDWDESQLGIPKCSAGLFDLWEARQKVWWQQRTVRKDKHQVKYAYFQRFFATSWLGRIATILKCSTGPSDLEVVGLAGQKRVVAAESSKENYDFDCINTDVNTNSGQISILITNKL